MWTINNKHMNNNNNNYLSFYDVLIIIIYFCHSHYKVQLEGVWFFVDCTYGSGILSEGCFMSKFTSDYFFIPPEQLIFSHWPDDKQWQLLEYPVCLSELQPLQVLSPCSLNLCKRII